MSTNYTDVSWTYEPSTQMRYSYLVLTADFDEDASTGAVLCRTSDCIPEDVARLIAAAPDLLAACKALLARVDEPGATVRSITGRDVAAIRAAIAKAEGGEA